MANCCDENPLKLSGTGQRQRMLPALKASHVLVDERSYAQWINFAEQFSRYLQYYNTANEVAGDWRPFFSNDISAMLGAVAIQNIDAYRLDIKQRFRFLRDNDNAADITGLKRNLNELFAAVFTLTKALDHVLLRLPLKQPDGEKDFALRGTLLNLLRTKLLSVLKRLIAYYFAIDGTHPGAVDYREAPAIDGWNILNLPVMTAEQFLQQGVSEAGWGVNWTTLLPAITPDSSIYGPTTWTDHERIVHAANHNLFSSAFDQYLQVYTKTVQLATDALLQTLAQWDAHPAHYALFLAFLKVFKVAQDDLNTITQRHLDFYYKDILRLRPKDAEPNHAYVLVELAKQTDSFALLAGTAFKAGKDSAGNDVTYTLDSETVFNKAKVVSLRSFYKGNALGKDDILSGTTVKINNKERFFASPVANSNDGMGAELKSPNKEWHPYVNKRFTDGVLTAVAMPRAAVGFAVASHYLFLTEGDRRVILRVCTSNNAALSGLVVDCYLTTAKAWHHVQAQFTVSVTKTLQPCAELSLVIQGDVPPIVNYDAAVHGGTLAVALPVMKVTLPNADDLATYSYEAFKTLRVTDVELEVQVGMEQSGYTQTGLKQLTLSNDFGPLDASKPFQPFGPRPVPGNRLVVGNKELFSKQNASPVFHLEWKGAGDFDSTTIAFGTQSGDGLPNIVLKYLQDGRWQAESSDEIFVAGTEVSNFRTLPSTSFMLKENTLTPYSDEYTEYNAATMRGFLSMQLTEGFGHKAYQDELTRYLVKLAKDPDTDDDPPEEPYTPEM